MNYILLKNLNEVFYEEDTMGWHIWLDLHHADKIVKGDVFTINDLVLANDMSTTYYENSLDILLADEIITVVKQA